MPFVKGCIPWNKGRPHGKPWGRPFQRDYVPWNKGVNVQLNTGRTHFQEGHIPFQKGRKLNQTQLDALLKANIGKHQSNETRLKHGKSLLGKRRGSKCNFWKGGINPLRMAIRDLSDSTRWRKLVFERDNYTCQLCNERGSYLEAHHLKSFADIFSEFLERYSSLSPVNDKPLLLDLAIRHDPFWNIDNGMTLCKNCHTEIK